MEFHPSQSNKPDMSENEKAKVYKVADVLMDGELGSLYDEKLARQWTLWLGLLEGVSEASGYLVEGSQKRYYFNLGLSYRTSVQRNILMIRLYNLIDSIKRSVLIGGIFGNQLPSQRFAMPCFQPFKASSICFCTLIVTRLAIQRRHTK